MGGWDWETGANTFTLLMPRVKQTPDGNQPRGPGGLGLMPAGDQNGKEVHREGTCQCTADSLC